MRVAAVQFTATTDKAANLDRLSVLVRRAADAGAALIVCPEAAMYPFGSPAEPLHEMAEPLDGPFVSGLAAVAADVGVTVLAGLFETAGAKRAYNTVVALGAGGLLGAYRKVHLFDALGWVESDRLAVSDVEPLVLPCGELTVGVMTCYDLRFPELARVLVDGGADLLAVPAAWVAGPMKEEQWATLARARAIENTSYVVAAGQGGPVYAGRSLVIDPFGVVLADAGEADGVLLAEAEPARVAEVRRRVPSLAHRRFDVVVRP